MAACLAVALGGALPALAQRPAAQALAEQARAHFVAGEYAEALDLYEQAFQIDAHPAILYNEARCFEELGDLPHALDRFHHALDLNPTASIRDDVEAKIAELNTRLQQQGYHLDQVDPDTYPTVAALSVTSLPDGAAVFIDGNPVGTTPLDSLFMAPGEYELSVALDGYQTHVRTIDIEPGRNLTVHAGLRRLEAVTEYRPPEPGFVDLTGPRRDMDVYLDDELIGRTPLSGTAVPPGEYVLTVRHPDFQDWSTTLVVHSGETTHVYADAQRRAGLVEARGMDAHDWGLISGVAGGAVVVAGVVFGVLAQADADRYARNVNSPSRADIRDSAVREALIADIGFATGGALLITSAVLLFAVGNERGEAGEEDLVFLELGPTPRGVAVGLGGRF